MGSRVRCRWIITGVSMAIVASFAACSGGDTSSGGSAAKGEAKVPASVKSTQGGVLRIGMVNDPQLDPATDDYFNEHFWAYLTRTLLTYPLKPVTAGGGEVVPDLAEAQPKVSDDGLTWTLTLKPGVKYAPPFADREIVAQDVATAIQRVADPAVASPFASFFQNVKGFAAAQKSPGKPISGIEVVDPHTISFHLTKPTPTFADSLAIPASAPVPAEAVKGHAKDYGRFLVASGPYMVKGSEALDFSAAPDQQKPLSGYVPDRSLQLVRNPSWDRSTDAVRGANPDAVDFEVGGTAQTIADKVSTSDVDVLMDDSAPPQVVARHQTDPALRGQLHINPKLTVRVHALNLAQAPFDDVHVRRAANFILNRTAAARVGAGKASASPADHFFVPGLVDNLNADFRPYESTSTADALAQAQKEMKQSKYDPGKAGKCTAPECSDIRFIPLEVDDPANELLRQDFARIGLGLKAESYSPETAFAKCSDPSEKVAICSGYTFGANSTDAESIAQYLYTSGIGPEGCCNAALLGATPKQLASFGYAGATPPPNVEPGLLHCSTLAGKPRDQCYASEDRRISTEVVPFVYALFPNELEVVSSRVRNYTYDQFGYMSLNYAAIAP